MRHVLIITAASALGGFAYALAGLIASAVVAGISVSIGVKPESAMIPQLIAWGIVRIMSFFFLGTVVSRLIVQRPLAQVCKAGFLMSFFVSILEAIAVGHHRTIALSLNPLNIMLILALFIVQTAVAVLGALYGLRRRRNSISVLSAQP